MMLWRMLHLPSDWMAAVGTGIFVGAGLYIMAVASLRYSRYTSIAQGEAPSKTNPSHIFHVYHATSYLEFPFIATKSLQFALFISFAIPSISSLLVSTGEFEKRCGARYDDTDLILRELLERPLSTTRAKTAIRRLNYIHGQYNISNADFVYVLVLFMVIPIQWINRYGYRRLHPYEIEAHFLHFQRVGELMGINEIPETMDEAEKFMTQFENKFMRYARTNKQIADRSVGLFLMHVPAFLKPFGRQVIYALVPNNTRSAVGFPEPMWGLEAAVNAVMICCAFFVRWFMFPREKACHRTPTDSDADGLCCPLYHDFEQTYKDGYYVEQLGPAKFGSSLADPLE